ncbi:MAG: class I SAM-dependent methyltransferase [Opitutaceae bacterium]
MKVRDSGMPDERYWESLFDVAGILDALKIDRNVGDAVEVGCGYGTFTVPTAQRIGGTLHSFDIESKMIERTRARAAAAMIGNLRLDLRDVIVDGFGVPANSVDAVLLFNILHAVSPVEILRRGAEAVRPGGRLLGIHWRSDVATPRGPDLSIRPRPEQIAEWARSAGLYPEPSQLLPPWHFGIVLRR